MCRLQGIQYTYRALILFFVTGEIQLSESNDGVSVTAEREVMIQEKWFGGWNRRDYAAVASVYSDDIVHLGKDGETKGVERIVNCTKLWVDVMPDLVIDSLCLTWDKDVLVAHWRCTGTLEKKLYDIEPTHQKTSFFGHTCFRFKDNQVTHHWACVDYRPFTLPTLI